MARFCHRRVTGAGRLSYPRGILCHMARFTFLHAADLHLDTPFEGLGALHPSVAAALRDASLEAWDRLVETACRRRVAFVLLAGDLYDGPERGIRAQFRFLRGLERLAAAGIEVFVVHGNHDPVEEGWTAVRSFPAGVHVFAPGEPQAVEVVRDGRRIAVVHGTSFRRREERENLARRFRRAPGPGLQIGLLHAQLEGQQGHDPWAPCSLADLRASGLDYWALGHVHRRQVVVEGDPGWVVYPGNLHGRSFKPSECGEKGSVVVEVEHDRVAGVEFVPLAPIRFERIRLSIDGLPDLPSLVRALAERAEAVRGLRGTLCRAELVGAGPLHAEIVRSGEELLEALREATAPGDPWIAWDRIEAKTAPPVDREDLLGRDDFAGAFLRRLDALRGDGAELARLVAEIDAELGKGGIGRWIDPADDEELLALLGAAERFAIERLGGGA